MYVLPSTPVNRQLIPTNSSLSFPQMRVQPQGDVYTSANDKELAKKRALNPLNILIDTILGAVGAWAFKARGNSRLAIASLIGIPLGFMGLRALGGIFDSEWDKRHPPKNQNGAILHEIFRPSGLLDLAWIGIGLATLKGNVSGLKQGGMRTLDSAFNLDFLLFAPAIAIFDRYKEGQEKFKASNR